MRKGVIYEYRTDLNKYILIQYDQELFKKMRSIKKFLRICTKSAIGYTNKHSFTTKLFLFISIFAILGLTAASILLTKNFYFILLVLGIFPILVYTFYPICRLRKRKNNLEIKSKLELSEYYIGERINATTKKDDYEMKMQKLNYDINLKRSLRGISAKRLFGYYLMNEASLYIIMKDKGIYFRYNLEKIEVLDEKTKESKKIFVVRFFSFLMKLC